MKLSSMKDDFVWLVDCISTFIENVSLGSFACLSCVNRVFGIYRIYNVKHEPVIYGIISFNDIGLRRTRQFH